MPRRAVSLHQHQRLRKPLRAQTSSSFGQGMFILFFILLMVFYLVFINDATDPTLAPNTSRWAVSTQRTPLSLQT
jgi:isoprenylcysteine carboxyl methyltransferase (ICMT) family protein YpbQ